MYSLKVHLKHLSNNISWLFNGDLQVMSLHIQFSIEHEIFT